MDGQTDRGKTVLISLREWGYNYQGYIPITRFVLLQLPKAGIDTQHIMHVSGYKSESTIKHYVQRLSDHKNINFQIV